MARHESNLRWLSRYKHFKIRVYDKNPNNPILLQGLSSITLPNVGREAHTFLTHIVTEYDNLENWTIFTQDNAPSVGYLGHRKGGGHLAFGSSFDDYLFPRSSGHYLVYTSAFHTKENHSFFCSVRRQYYEDSDAQINKNVTTCPDVSDWGMWWPMGWFETMVREKAKEQHGMGLIEFYNTFVEPDASRTDQVTIGFAQGGRMGVSKELIRARSKMYYINLLAQLNHIDSYSGYYIEWLWPAIFRLEQCAFVHHRELSHKDLFSPAFPPSPPRLPPISPPSLSSTVSIARTPSPKKSAPLPLIISAVSVGSAFLGLCICLGIWILIKSKRLRCCRLLRIVPRRRAAVLDIVDPPKSTPSPSDPPREPEASSPPPPPPPQSPPPPPPSDPMPSSIETIDVTLKPSHDKPGDKKNRELAKGEKVKRPSRNDLSRRSATRPTSNETSERRRAHMREAELARARR